MPRNQTAEELGLFPGTIVRVEKNDRVYTAMTVNGQNVADKIESYALKNAFREKKALLLVETKNKGTSWRKVSLVEYDKALRGESVTDIGSGELNIGGEQEYSEFETQDDLIAFIQDSYSLKPAKLKIAEIAWKFAVRTVVRGKNMLVTGPSGCGKTLLYNALKVALGKEDKFFYINLGSTQDPRSTLVGNTHFKRDENGAGGTYVALSYFAKAIQVPGAIVLLDEVSRAHPDAINILIPVLDATQRYLRVDEKEDSPTIKVAPGVSFIGTANIGSEYTATRTMDRALLDRFVIFEMQPLSKEDELANLQFVFPNVQDKYLEAVADIASVTRQEIKQESPKVDTIISTRMAEELVGCIYDGLKLGDAAEMCIYPYFSDAGGADCPRSFVRGLVQAKLETDLDKESVMFKNKNNLNGNKSSPFSV